MTTIGKISRFLLPPRFHFVLVRIYQIYLTWRDRERKLSFGALNPDKTFYVIRITSKKVGLFAVFSIVLEHAIKAIERGYIPIVDLQNYKTAYNYDEPINGTMNAWEYYFRQPSNYTLEEVYKSKNVILCSLTPIADKAPPHLIEFWTKNENIAPLSEFVCSKLLFNDHVMDFCKAQRKSIIGDKKNVLCVCARHPEYGKNICCHPLQPDSYELLKKAQECFEKWNMEYVFISTDYIGHVYIFKEIFKDKLLHIDFNNKKLFDASFYGSYSDVKETPREVSTYDVTLNYISEIWIASKCDAIVCAIANGAMAALELNNNQYKHRYIFDFGTWDRPKERKI
ncbi:MAG: hypothetical protein LBN32_04310 [Helicobacteraceae bacterium]|jgi:hypothetical protein|nr:hypothetical protein [Helicobacteraceae bacterium]